VRCWRILEKALAEGRWMRCKPRQIGGFTLPELLISLTLVGILAIVAAPQFGRVHRGAVLAGAAEQLLGDFQRAQAEAIKRNRGVTIRKTGDTTYDIEFLGTATLDGAVFAQGPDSVRLAPFGPPLTGSATYVLSSGSYSKSVILTAAGHTRLQ